MSTYVAAFLSILLAELGDKTQLATLLFAATPGVSRVGVFLAAASALVLSSGLAVLMGTRLGSWLSPQHLKVLAGAVFITIGAWMLVSR